MVDMWDYYNGWKEQDEELLFNMLSQTKAKFILSTWHHNDWRENDMIKKFWGKFNIVTKTIFTIQAERLKTEELLSRNLFVNLN